jgi:hypothetical protein
MSSFLRSFVRVAAALTFFATILFSQQSTSKARPARPHVENSAPSSSNVDPGTLRDGVYRNPTFGFSYKLPITWVDRTEEMQQDSQSPSDSQVLFAAFSRPPEAAGESINAAVIIAAEKVSNYPGLKHAADYFEPLTAATTSKGFKVVNKPYEFSIGAKLLVRSDFSREEGPQKMYQSSLAMLAKDYVLSFTIVTANQDDVETLLSNLSFGVQQRPDRGK